MRTHHHRGLVPGARLRQRDRTGRRLMTRPLRAMAVALAVLLVLPIAGCRDEVPAPEYQGGGAATRGGHEGPRPEGVSDTDTPITSLTTSRKRPYRNFWIAPGRRRGCRNRRAQPIRRPVQITRPTMPTLAGSTSSQSG